MGLRLTDEWLWDSWFAQDDDGALHLFYLKALRSLGDSDTRHDHTSVGHAVTTDLERWEVLPDALTVGPPGSWDDRAIWTGSVIRAPDGWQLFYTGRSNADGGWSQLAGANSDAYATGMVLVALRWGIGLPVSDPTYKSGIEYLLKTQEADGSWFVTKRAAAANAYFESGFPHGKFQFISYAGSCWATMALMYAAAPPVS